MGERTASKERVDIKYRCYRFSLNMLHFVGEIKVNVVYRSLLDQVVRSSTSIGANVVEGRSGSSMKDLIRFYQIALKSANETKYWLCLIRDSIDVDKAKMNALLREADELAKIIAKSVMTLKNKTS